MPVNRTSRPLPWSARWRGGQNASSNSSSENITGASTGAPTTSSAPVFLARSRSPDRVSRPAGSRRARRADRRRSAAARAALVGSRVPRLARTATVSRGVDHGLAHRAGRLRCRETRRGEDTKRDDRPADHHRGGHAHHRISVTASEPRERTTEAFDRRRHHQCRPSSGWLPLGVLHATVPVTRDGPRARRRAGRWRCGVGHLPAAGAVRGRPVHVLRFCLKFRRRGVGGVQ